VLANLTPATSVVWAQLRIGMVEAIATAVRARSRRMECSRGSWRRRKPATPCAAAGRRRWMGASRWYRREALATW